ncbi:MAG: sulfatase [Planctomycetota bacterium]
MTRLRPSLYRTATCALVVLAAASCGSKPPPPPSVLLVTIDTLRADHTSLYGYDVETTPELERWAAGGRVYEHAWAASSWTAPSMAMLLTGRARTDNSGTIRPSELSLAEILQGYGYATGAVIANPLLNESQGYARGFDNFEIRGAGEQEWNAERVLGRGQELLESYGERRPYFLYLHLFDPHYPYFPDEEGEPLPIRNDSKRRTAFRNALPEDKRDLFGEEEYRGIETLISLYDGEIRRTDRALGRLFAWMEERGLGERTLVIVTSDHGEGLWQRAPAVGEELKNKVFFPHLYYSHGVQLYSEQVGVPLVMRGPGMRQGDTRSEDVSLLDVVPTVLEIVGIDNPGDLSGLSLAADYFPETGREIYSVCSRVSTVTVDGRWRLHVPREHRVDRYGARPELYDLSFDPKELSPLDDTIRTKQLVRLVAAWRARNTGVPEGEIDQEQLELLESLGYTGEADR